MRSCTLLEVCVDSVDGVVAARDGGADRVELCSGLIEGGVTPSLGALEAAVRAAGIPIHVLVRPRGGDFCYSAAEIGVMERDIAAAKAAGASGVVLGVLVANGAIDRERTAALVGLARPLSVTFHRAFDMARDPAAALEDLVALGIDRLLTSGQERSALEGLDLIQRLVRQAAGRIAVMPGGGVTEGNVRQIVDTTRAGEVHATARTILESSMQHRNPRCFLGGELLSPEYERKVTDSARVRSLVAALRGEGEAT